MGRANRFLPVKPEEAIRLFAEHHIVAIRRKRRGEIASVKHVMYGWMSPQRYYALQKAHDAMPSILKIVEGGYRAKAALWGTSLEAEVFATGVKLPLGALIIAGAFLLYLADARTAAEARSKAKDARERADAIIVGPEPSPPGTMIWAAWRARKLAKEAIMLEAARWAKQAEQDTFYSYMDLFALAIPFGEVYLVWRGVISGWQADPKGKSCEVLKAEFDALWFMPSLQGPILLAARAQGCAWANP